MPISRDQFEHESDNTQTRVLQFLDHHPRQAFTIAEIQEGIAYASARCASTRDINWFTVFDAAASTVSLIPILDDLEKLCMITSKTISGERYFTIRL